MTTEMAIRPQVGPQEAFLRSSADIAIYGGAAGGGKSWSLITEPLYHVENPAFAAVIFRRTYPQITNPGGLWSEALKVYPSFGARATLDDLVWTFPAGATVKLSHLQHEKNIYDWQGGQIVLLEWDELTHFTEFMFWYLTSRLRSTSGIKPYVRATCNPDADSWVAALIAWWIDQETGFAIPERSGVLRWFVRISEKLHWADTPAELRARYPDSRPKSLTFIPAKLEDNQILEREDPDYRAWLMALPLVERERLLGGNWKVRPASGKVFNRGWFPILDAAPVGGEECRFWDFAATEKQIGKPDPDFTAGVKVRRVGGRYIIMDCLAVQAGPAETERIFERVSRQDAIEARGNGLRYRVRWEVEPGAAAKRDSLRLTQVLAGLDALGRMPRGDKLVRARGLAAQAEAGNVALLRGGWNEEWLTHMHHQPEWPHDDIMDGSSGAFNELAPAGGIVRQDNYLTDGGNRDE